jgi:hypothetical protein
MHFLSHYYVDRASADAPFAAGALLPDIAPGFTKTYNGAIRNKLWNFEGPVAAIHRGVLRHYELDARFHNSPDFKEACAHATQCLLGVSLDREKYRFWFLGHIAVEVLLDRQLIIEEPGIVKQYYELLSSIDINNLDAYLNFIVQKEDKSKILSNFMKFVEVKFLRYLSEIEGAAEGIAKTVYRATGIDFTDIDRKRLITALHNIEGDIRYRRKKLLEITA